MSIEVRDIQELSDYSQLSPATIQQLAQSMNRIDLKVGQLLCHQGDSPPGFYILKNGRAILYRQSKSRSQILSVLFGGESFGGESLSTETPCPYTAKTISLSRVFYLPAEKLILIQKECPDFLKLYLELMAARMRQLTGLIHDLAFRSVAARIAGVLLMLAEAEGEISTEGLRIKRLFTQQEVASMAGTAREVVYRTLKQFEQDELIRQSSSEYYLLNIERISQIAAEEVR